MIKANQICNDYLAADTEGPADLSQRIQSLDVTESFLVKAPAGSGKTELLSQRYLALLSIVREPEEALAITFTNKAGTEMRARIINALHRADSQPEPEASHDKLTWRLAKNALSHSKAQGWDVLNNPNRLRIKTIDAFYSSLARRSPVSSLVGKGMQVTDDYRLCYVNAAREMLGELESDAAWTTSLEAVLTHVDNRFDRAEDLLISLLEKREHWLPVVLSARDTEDLRDRLEQTLRIIAAEIITEVRGDIEAHTGSIVDLASFAVQHFDLIKCPELLPLKKIAQDGALPGEEASDIRAWGALSAFFLTKGGALRKSSSAAIGFPAPSGVKDKEQKALYTQKKKAFKEFMELLSSDPSALQSLSRLSTLPPTTYEDGEWDILENLLMLLPILAAKLLIVFQRENAVDHSEIASGALRVLGEPAAPTDLALILDAQLKHILIDEFQDTNNLQMSGLELITAGWEVDDGRTLFLVGDAQQSIYGFRGSNVGLFLEVTSKGVGSLPITPVELTVNFRSQKGIVDWVNESFNVVFPKGQNTNLGAIPYSPSVSHLPMLIGETAVKVVGFAGELDDTRYAEGKWLASTIRDIRDNNNSASMAILVRNRSHLESTVSALQEMQIPYQAIEIDPLKDRDAIRDLSSLTRALCHLGDRIAWLALLRSPLCGLELSEIEVLVSSNPNALVWECINDAEAICRLRDDSIIRVHHLSGVLKESMRWRERKQLTTIIEGAWLALYGPSSIEQEMDLENVEAFFHVLKRFSYTAFNIELFESALDGLYAKPNTTGDNLLQVMTLHKSKGLQFDHVFIPGCERQSRANETRLLAWDRFTTRAGKELPLLSSSPEIGGGSNALYAFINKQESMRTELERDRILYVGCTRAIKHLYLTCSLACNDGNDILPPSKSSFMGALWPGVESQVEVIAADEKCSKYAKAFKPTASLAVKLDLRGSLPNLPSENLLSEYRGRMATNNASLPDLAWKVDYSRHVGTLFHRILRRVCLDGAEHWNEPAIDCRKEVWRHQLLQLGVPAHLCPAAINAMVGWLTKTLHDSKGQWLLSNRHAESACELPVSSTMGGELKRYVIDRTFIDNGTRWIIDYKSSSPAKDESAIEFDSRMVREHRGQLSEYRELLSSLGTEPVKCAIYLVSVQSFVEIEF